MERFVVLCNTAALSLLLLALPTRAEEAEPGEEPGKPKEIVDHEGMVRLHVDGEGKLFLLLASLHEEKKYLELLTGERMQFGKPKRVDVPKEVDDVVAFDSVLDSKGTLHVFAAVNVNGDITDVVVHYVQISSEGEILLPWTNLTSELGLERQPYLPALLPLPGGRMALFTTGRMKEAGALVTAEVSEKQVRVLARKALPENRFVFSLEGSHGQPVAASTKSVWLLDCDFERVDWVNPGNGRRTLWFSAGRGKGFLIDQQMLTIATPRGQVVSAVVVADEEAEGDGEAQLLVATAKPGSKCTPVEVPGTFREGVPMALLSSSKGAVYLITATRTGPKDSMQETLGIWYLSSGKPRPVGKVCEVEGLSAIAAALVKDTQIHVVYQDIETLYGVTLRIGKN